LNGSRDGTPSSVVLRPRAQAGRAKESTAYGDTLYMYCGTVRPVIFKLNPVEGQPLYLQLMQQIRHAIETGGLQDGDLLPGIRTLAQELVVSHNTVAKAYSELEHEGLVELRHGSGAFVSAGRRMRLRSDKLLVAQSRVRSLVQELYKENLSTEELRRLFEAALTCTTEDFYEQSTSRRNK
jgi:GntR family transcriptional regulator